MQSRRPSHIATTALTLSACAGAWATDLQARVLLEQRADPVALCGVLRLELLHGPEEPCIACPDRRPGYHHVLIHNEYSYLNSDGRLCILMSVVVSWASIRWLAHYTVRRGAQSESFACTNHASEQVSDSLDRSWVQARTIGDSWHVLMWRMEHLHTEALRSAVAEAAQLWHKCRQALQHLLKLAHDGASVFPQP